MIALMMSFGNAIAADITLQEKVEPQGSVIRLGEIAKITDVDVHEAERLARVPLMAAPAPGTEATVRAQEIRELLVAHGVDLGVLRFDGAIRVTVRSPEAAIGPNETPVSQTPKSIAQPSTRNLPRSKPRQQSGYRLPSSLVTRKTQDLPTRSRVSMSQRRLADLTTSLKTQLNEHIRESSRDPMLSVVEVELESRNAESLAQARGRINIDHTGDLQPGRQRFLVAFESLFGPVRFPVFVQLQRAEPVVVTIRAIPRGQVITAADVRVEPSTGKRFRDNESPLPSIEQALGQEAGRSLREGQVLTDANCIPPIMVKRGDTVDVIAGGGGVRVRMRAIAKRDGRLGDTVDVETVGDKRKLSARVTNHGTLAIVSPGQGRVATFGTSRGRVR